ncbi:branched-chain amino acid ABC transporter permease [Acuticoccus kandeliae]|uniref:branched-chain amino acid ABC transporter permease n=1 Tax=Acuticoccus kandeliae TaxID=2073160 RepID=UPI000D3EA24D|nr:branched-chain amino acid ABC transporter permease [Acuticoccus kandeliae]
MFYREAGQFKTTYVADQAAFPIREDRLGILALGVIGAVIIPLLASDFFLNAVMIPFLIFTLATIGLNVLTGYCGQLSLGTGAFMGVGAYSCYKLTSIFPDVNIVVWILASGFFAAAIGVLFGLPSLRIKGFYLAVATLAAQFFLEWCFIRIPWLYNYNASGAIEVPTRTGFGFALTGPTATPLTRYFVVLAIVALLTFLVGNLIRGRIGRTWMMIRDMDIAAELIGVRPLAAKLSAFAVSSFVCGVAGAMFVFFWLGAAEPSSFNIRLSFQILFMVILGGLGSMAGSYMGAAFIFILPIIIRMLPAALGLDLAAATVEQLNFLIVGALIIGILIIEPHGLARLWSVARQKLRVWPFPY